MEALVNLLKASIKLFLWLTLSVGAASLLYGFYNSVTADQALTIHTAHDDWQWQRSRDWWSKEPSDAQWRIDFEGDYILRRVYPSESVTAWLQRDDDGNISLRANVRFFVDCNEGTSVVTDVVDSEGNAFELRCQNSDGRTSLSVGVVWDHVDMENLPSWDENFGGFEVDENFDFSWRWDFKPALRQLTLKQL